MNRTISSILLPICVLALSACNIPPTASTPEVAPMPAITLAIQVQSATDTFDTVGESINYQYTVTNTGNMSLVGPVNVNADKAPATCPNLNTVGDLDNDLDPNETMNCTGSYPLTQDDIDNGRLTNNATASVGGTSSNQTSVEVTLAGNKGLTLTRSASPTTYSQAGETITFTYVIQNTGTTSLGPAQFVVNDDHIAAPINCGPETTTLAANQTVTCTASYTITQADLNTGSVTTNATASGADVSVTQPVTTTLTKNSDIPNPPATSYVPGTTVQHTVKSGEWLMQIARCYGADYRTVRRANLQIFNPSRIVPNMIVTVPNIGSKGNIYGPPCVEYYTAQNGDTWDSIAQTYNADGVVLRSANRGAVLVSGRVLRVPVNSAGGASPTPTETPIRITFDPGTTSTRRIGVLSTQGVARYVLYANRGQVMTVSITAPANEVALAIYAPNGITLKPQDTTVTWSGVLAATGDYRIDLISVTGAPQKSYTLDVSVAGDAGGPTSCNRAEFVEDVSIPDGTSVPADTTFTKIWRLKNTGSCTWTTGYAFIWAGGERMDAPEAAQLTVTAVPSGATVDLPIDLKSPARAGSYQANFRLRAEDGTVFGVGPNGQNPFWVRIVVPQPTLTSKIAFTSNDDIYVMNADGSNQVNLTNSSDVEDYSPVWSPDGSKIAFMVASPDFQSEIYVMNADGSNRVRLTTSNADNRYLTWSPDGIKIGFMSDRDGTFDIHVMNADGSNQVRLTANGGGGPPSWSADGSKIVFGGNGIYMINTDGTNEVRLASGFSPIWSPDGSKIVFVSTSPSGDATNEIFIINADGSDQTRLTNNNNTYEQSLAWSPDGNRIAFISVDVNLNAVIYVINADGSNQLRLTDAPAAYSYSHPWPLTWSPDGNKIAFASRRDGRDEIYVINADGSNLVKLTSTGGSYDPAWSP